MFSLFALASSVTNTKHQTNTDTKFTEQVMIRFQEVNEIYDGTRNKIHHLFYSSEKTTDETFTFREAIKQEDKLSFVEAIEK